MAANFTELLTALEEQKQIYQELVQLAQEKQDCLVKNAIEALDSVTKREEALIFRAARLEEDRYQAAHTLFDQFQLQENATFKELLELVPAPQESKISAVVQELTVLLDKLQKFNQENTSLIQQSLRFVNFSMEVLGGQAQSTYNSEKEVKAVPLSRLLDKKV